MDVRESKQDSRLGMHKLVVRFPLLGARGIITSRSVLYLTNKTQLWRGFCLALHEEFTESRIIFSGKLIHKFYAPQFRRDFISVPTNVKLAVFKLKRSRP